MTDHRRMILELPPEVQMAIRLRAVKLGIKAGEVVAQAVSEAYPAELAQARQALEEQKP